VTSRAESTAITREALLAAAAELLDRGGPDAVTLREVGARAGVSRNAPYRHFPDKEGLLTALAVEGWDDLAERLGAIAAGVGDPTTGLEEALLAIMQLARTRPHLYRLMFIVPERDPEAGARAASAATDELLGIVGAVVGEPDARRYTALLFSSVHGMAALEGSGHLTEAKWQATPESLLPTLVGLTVDAAARG